MTYIVAEIGINHNGSLELATRLTEAASASGVNAVKLQNYDVNDFVTDKSLTYTYQSQGLQVTESQYEMFKRYQVDEHFIQHVARVCHECGLDFISTPTSPSGVDLLASLNCKYVKNGSDFLSNHLLIQYMISSGMHVVLSTGMADQSQIDSAYSLFKPTQLKNLTLLHCTSSYPTLDADVNLNRMISMQDRYDCNIGFSDHTMGSFAAVASAILGSTFIEKHYTLDHDLPGPDHWFSITPSELASFVSDIRRADLIKGSTLIEPSLSEIRTMHDSQLSLIYSRSLNSGTVLCENMFASSRPGSGIPLSKLPALIGKKLIIDVSINDQVNLNHLQ